jgi:hypothetical protein
MHCTGFYLDLPAEPAFDYLTHMKTFAPHAAVSAATAAPARGRSALAAEGEAFGAALQQATVRSGDNLTSMVKSQARRFGVELDESSAYRMALDVAKANRLADADRIDPGQRLDMGLVAQRAQGMGREAASWQTPTSQAWLAAKTAPPAMGAGVASDLASVDTRDAAPSAAASGVLDLTLQRAAAKGFIAPGQQDAVRERIQVLAKKHGFSPDDFALLSLMESDGLNPQASNGSCHGVIQFCEGPNRGAASVGMAANPRAILGMGVLQQLDLVDRYLQDAGLPKGQPVGLDDLYLSVLTPAARAQRSMDAPLPIAGRQALALYVGRDPASGISRRSLMQGLVDNASARLGVPVAQLVAPASSTADVQVASVLSER